jgi:hypothetical protein
MKWDHSSDFIFAPSGPEVIKIFQHIDQEELRTFSLLSDAMLNFRVRSTDYKTLILSA